MKMTNGEWARHIRAELEHDLHSNLPANVIGMLEERIERALHYKYNEAVEDAYDAAHGTSSVNVPTHELIDRVKQSIRRLEKWR